jgi:beta-glucosidase
MQGRTYKYIKTEPMYPFGFGLSFSKFSYSDIGVNKKAFSSGDSVYVSCKLSNVGKVAGTEIIQLYIQHIYDGAPNYILKGIKKQTLLPGESRMVYFKLAYTDLSTFEEDGSEVVKPGMANLIIGGSLPIPRAEILGSSKPQIISITKL